jgi:superfamily II DNA/RNA helicase
VINYTLPEEPEDYVHRIGRTGRAGRTGISISFACEDDAFLLEPIEKLLGQKLNCTMPDDLLSDMGAPGAAGMDSDSDVSQQSVPDVEGTSNLTSVADDAVSVEAKPEVLDVGEADGVMPDSEISDDAPKAPATSVGVDDIDTSSNADDKDPTSNSNSA